MTALPTLAYREQIRNTRERTCAGLFIGALLSAASALAQSAAPVVSSGQVLFAPATYLGRSMSKEAPADALAPADPQWLAGMWSLRGVFERRDPQIKPSFQALLLGSPQANAPNAAGNPDPAQLCIPSA